MPERASAVALRVTRFTHSDVHDFRAIVCGPRKLLPAVARSGQLLMSYGKTRVGIRCTDLTHEFVDALLGAFANHEVNQPAFFALRRLVGAVGVNIYAESFSDKDHSHTILDDAQFIVDKAATEMEKL